MKNFDRDYNHHAPRNNEEAMAHAEVRDRCRALAEWLEHNIPPGQELALAHTHLEQVMMMANAGLARGRYDEENVEENVKAWGKPDG